MLNINNKKKMKRKENYKFIKKNYSLQLYIANNKYINIIIYIAIYIINILRMYIVILYFMILF